MTDEQLNARFKDIDSRFNEIDSRFNEIDARFNEIDARFNGVDARFQQMEDRILEAMRDMQTELLRGMAAYSGSINLRMRKVEADQSNLDAALSGRVEDPRKKAWGN